MRRTVTVVWPVELLLSKPSTDCSGAGQMDLSVLRLGLLALAQAVISEKILLPSVNYREPRNGLNQVLTSIL